MNSRANKIPVNNESAYEAGVNVGYDRALEDYAIKAVIQAVADNAGRPISFQESSLVTALLIEQLPQLFNRELIASYLDAIQKEQQQEVSVGALTLKYPQSIELPVREQTQPRRYQDWQKIRLIPLDGDDSEWGTIIGSYLAYHHCRWSWRYVLWLDRDSTSAGWLRATLAWEAEIESKQMEHKA
jgi:hypothetical protein